MSPACRVLRSRKTDAEMEVPAADARVWRSWKRIAKGDRINKVPCGADGKGLSRWQDPPFLSRDEALACGPDVGIVLIQQPSYTAVDLDGVLDDQGRVIPEAVFVVEAARGLYVERSVGRRGLHVVGRGSTTPYEVKFKPDAAPDGHQLPNVFLTISGDVFGEPGDPEADADAFVQFVREHYPAAAPAASRDSRRAKRAAATREAVIDAAKRLQVFLSEDPKQVNLRCPWSGGHTGAGRDDDHRDASVLIEDGHAAGFKCFHGSCSDKSLRDVLMHLGLGTPKSRGDKSHATQLIELAWDLELFCSPSGDAYAVVPGGETRALGERPFRNWLAARFYETTRGGTSGQAIHDAVTTLAGETYRRGKVMPVHVRVAAAADFVALDLGCDDRKALVIDRDGWRVTAPPDSVRLVRRPGMLPLPEPKRGGAPLHENIRKVTNVRSGDDLTMMIAWLVAALHGRRPFPVLVVKGEQGSAKSAGCRAVRSILDPSQAALSMTPKEPRDLVITASNSYMLAFDNLSFIPDWLSDALSGLATGAGFRTRALTTDKEEMIFEAARPLVLNGIPDLMRRGDLADRAVLVELQPISETERLTAAEVDVRFAEVRSEILGSLADAVSQAIREPVRPERLPRMADFACVVESAAPALGWQPGAFVEAYAVMRSETSASLLDGDPVAEALDAMRPGGDFEGNLETLLTRMKEVQPSDRLPKSSRGLSAALARLAPALRATGITYRASKRGTTRETRTRAVRVLFRGSQLPVDACGRVHTTQMVEVIGI